MKTPHQNTTKLLFLISLLLITACTTRPVITPAGQLAISPNTSSDFGYIMGFIGGTTKYPGNGTALNTKIFINYTADTTGKSFLKILGSGESEIMHKTDNYEGKVFLAKVPVGEYEVYSVHFRGSDNRGGKVESIFTRSNKLNVKFDVEKNTVSYVGSFIAKSNTRKGLLIKNHVNSGTGYFMHYYDLGRDQALTLENYSGLKGLEFKAINEIITQPPTIIPMGVNREKSVITE